jgi:hypothetical protein
MTMKTVKYRDTIPISDSNYHNVGITDVISIHHNWSNANLPSRPFRDRSRSHTDSIAERFPQRVFWLKCVTLERLSLPAQPLHRGTVVRINVKFM